VEPASALRPSSTCTCSLWKWWSAAAAPGAGWVTQETTWRLLGAGAATEPRIVPAHPALTRRRFHRSSRVTWGSRAARQVVSATGSGLHPRRPPPAAGPRGWPGFGRRTGNWSQIGRRHQFWCDGLQRHAEAHIGEAKRSSEMSQLLPPRRRAASCALVLERVAGPDPAPLRASGLSGLQLASVWASPPGPSQQPQLVHSRASGRR